jgi:hypothetical protein
LIELIDLVYFMRSEGRLVELEHLDQRLHF